jgi:Tol biopolymer transport system component
VSRKIDAVRTVLVVALVAVVACGVAAADTLRSQTIPGWGGDGPVWWPDGKRIVYSRAYSPAKSVGLRRLAIVRSDGRGGRQTITRPAAEREWWDVAPSVSPDGRRLLLTRKQAVEGSSYVVVREVATGAEQSLTPRFGDATGGNWSPDGTRLTYSVAPDDSSVGARTPYTARPDGSDPRPVADAGDARYLPGGELVVEAGGSISIVATEAGSERRLTPDDGHPWNLIGWASDGSHLLVLRDGSSEAAALWSLPTDGGRRVRLVAANDGAWSPDGSRLAYAVESYRKAPGLYLARADGSGARRISASGTQPAWSADGRTLAFSDRGDCFENGIYVVRASGGPPRRITENCHSDGTPRDDTILGSSERDVIRGGAGDDRIDANPGDSRPVYYGAWDYDLVDGGPGNDTILGRRGADTLRGGPGSDRILGGRGLDRIYGGPGRDVLEGGPYHDRLYARDGVRDTIRCGAGNDRVWADWADVVARDCERVLRR